MLNNEEGESCIGEAVDVEVRCERVYVERQFLGLGSLHAAVNVQWSYIDDTTGQVSNEECVNRARADELTSFYEMGVYAYVKREVAKRGSSGKLVGVRWVDI